MSEKLTTDERVEIILLCGQVGSSNRSVALQFNNLHPERTPIDQSTVGRLLKRFKETGSVHDRERSGRPRTATGEETATTVLTYIQRSPMKSTRKLSQETGVSRRSV